MGDLGGMEAPASIKAIPEDMRIAMGNHTSGSGNDRYVTPTYIVNPLRHLTVGRSSDKAKGNVRSRG